MLFFAGNAQVYWINEYRMGVARALSIWIREQHAGGLFWIFRRLHRGHRSAGVLALRRGDLIVQAAWAALRGGGDFIVVHPLLKGGRERVEEAAERGNNEERRDDHAGKLMQAR